MSAAPPPNPGLIFDTLNAYQRTEALRGAIELDVFTAVGEGAATAEAIARRCRASERGARILCDCLTTMGFLEKAGEEYRLTADSAAFLDRRSPTYLGTVARFIGMPAMTEGLRDVAERVREGGYSTEGGTLSPDHPVWLEFARSMAPLARLASGAVADLAWRDGAVTKVLDVACGHGVYGIAVAERGENVEVAGLDWAPVLEVAVENARASRIGGRYRTIAGSAFEVDLGDGYDLVLATNFLQLHGRADCERLLRRIHAAMLPGGRVLTLGFIPDESRVSPSTQAMFAMTMLGSTPEGDAYPFSVYEGMFANAGFARSEMVEIGPSRMVVSWR